MDNGWIKIHRQILKWEWYDDANTFRLFFHLLISANQQDNTWHGIEIKRGEHLTSLDKLAKALRLTPKKIRVAINHLKTTGEVADKVTTKYRIIKLNNYDSYQQEGKQEGKLGTKQGQARGNKQEGKEYKKEKNKEYDQKFEEFWITYPNKVGKKKAFSYWSKLTEKDKDSALAVLPSHTKNPKWAEEGGRFIPHPSTWLSQGRWEDEIEVKTQVNLKQFI